jgi:Zn-dependent peptidase ImmA (M78 family)
MSKLKTKIKIGYADIKIKLLNKKDYPKWCKDHFGEYDSNKSEMLINSNLSKIEEANTFLHELLHASIWISGLAKVIEARTSRTV